MGMFSESKKRRHLTGGKVLDNSDHHDNSRKRQLQDESEETNCRAEKQDCRLVTTSSSCEEAPWRVECVCVTGAPCEDDWWDSVGTNSSISSGSDSDSDSDEMSDGHRAKSSKKFHNCGLETWGKANVIWRAANREEYNQREKDGEEPNGEDDAPMMAFEGRKKLLKCLSRARNLRSYELPQQFNLKDVIKTYNTLWDEMNE